MTGRQVRGRLKGERVGCDGRRFSVRRAATALCELCFAGGLTNPVPGRAPGSATFVVQKGLS